MYVLLQDILYHCFITLRVHIQKVMEQSKLHAVELRISSKCRTMSPCFWEAVLVVDVELWTIHRDSPVVIGEVILISQLQSAVGNGPQIISWGV